MSPRHRLTLAVLAAAALAVCAAPSDNDIVQKPEVQKPDVQKPAVQNTRPAGVCPAGSPDTLEAVRPIDRYPHAVLYGGACGGSIISPKWILSAAHCTLFTAGRTVLAGTDNSVNGSGVRRRVKRLVVHPKFSVGPYWLNPEEYHIKQVAARWDFLLVELEDELPINNKTIAVVPLDSDTRSPPCLDVGYAGYGAEKHGETMRPDMHIMDMSIKADADCEVLEQYDATDMLCAQGRPPRYDSACNGDSGSGLVGNGKLMGVASWVEDDALECRNKTLVVFSRVAAVRKWVRDVTHV